MQRTFFDDEFEDDMQAKKFARRADPETSHRAADELVTSGNLSRLQAAALELIQTHPLCTASELEQIAGWQVHKRLGELKRSGRIIVAGTRECVITGRRAQVYKET
jgi:hypothetical protein